MLPLQKVLEGTLVEKARILRRACRDEDRRPGRAQLRPIPPGTPAEILGVTKNRVYATLTRPEALIRLQLE
jgi:hypothetical protein